MISWLIRFLMVLFLTPALRVLLEEAGSFLTAKPKP